MVLGAWLDVWFSSNKPSSSSTNNQSLLNNKVQLSSFNMLIVDLSLILIYYSAKLLSSLIFMIVN